MKIGFDVSQTSGEKTGCGYFTLDLIQNLANIDSRNHYLLYPTFGNHYWHKKPNKTFNMDLPNFKRGMSHRSLDSAKEFWKKKPNEIEKELGFVDILHTNNYFCPPKLPRTKLIYTLFDLSFIVNPEATTEHNRMACFDGVFKASVTADAIIAISEYSKNHFLKTFPHYPKENIKVIYPGCRSFTDIGTKQPNRLKHLNAEKFWLNIGTIEPRKNIRRLLLAYAELKRQEPQTYPLVIAGKSGWLEKDFEYYIETLGLKNCVHLLGYVDNNTLQWLYKHCFCFIYPSLFEGFGLPVLEAMNLGAPVIASNTSTLPEVVGHAGILINPLDEKDLLEAMMQLSKNSELRNQLKKKSLNQAPLFSSKKMAEETLSLYENLMTKAL